MSISPMARRRLAVGAAALLALAPLSYTAQASVPPPDSGWTQVWTDDFNGNAGTLPSSSNWIFDIGHSYPGGAGNWGTGEIESHTNNPANVSLDGGGNLRITPLKDGAGNWTSARIETQRTDFKPPAGGGLGIEGRIQMPNVARGGGVGHLAAVLGPRSPVRGDYLDSPGIGGGDLI